ncbi:MAG: hypothetical protein LC737_02730, partial [Chloroflexi bacterium]|nr:hypothetical protein [Chloroflexota bacterium]
FEYSIVQPAGNPQRADPDASATGNEALDPPGQPQAPRRTAAQLAHPSRLVFKVPADVRIPFSISGLLDWSQLELSVNPIAAIPPNPTQQQVASAPAIQPPTATETALELPYRLVISPNRDVVWEHRTEQFTSHGRTELWHTRLALKTPDGVVELSREQRAPLRAIWSPDYTPIKPPDPSATNKPATMDRDLWRTAMDANDRYQIVVLTSAFRGYEVDVEFTRFNIFAAARFADRIGVGERVPFKLTVPFVPQPFEAEQLILSPLGAWLRSRGNWTPPRPAKPVPRPRLNFEEIFRPLRLDIAQPLDVADNLAANVRGQLNIGPIFPGLFVREPEPLDLSEWVHIASQGRDHYVRIVYEGELWPFRHRAAPSARSGSR